ncbi:MAG: Thiol:disulfide interchange protein DsbD [Verrucomicrobia subdivision 3 bacterium]|nr:Thiol:disulfide interchange protein DsbD [Limisphaerales bacterium]MCS1412969.1 Thiol:disulfide interchange protein DsbD [Limisphaerales bacterium]
MKTFLEIEQGMVCCRNMRRWLNRAFLGVLALCPLVSWGAATTKVELLLSADQSRSGETVWAGVRFELADEWHTYWRYGGEAAQPPEIIWQLPEGVTAGEIQWPAPEKLNQQGIYSYVYHHETTLLVPLSISSPEGTLDIKARVKWLECKEACVPREADVSATLVVGDSSAHSDAANLIDQWRAKIPRVDAELPLKVAWAGEGAGDERGFVVFPGEAQDWELKDFYPHAYDDFEVTGETVPWQGEGGQEGICKTVFKYDGAWPNQIAGLVAIQKEAGEEPELVETVLAFGSALKGLGGVVPGGGDGVGRSSPTDVGRMVQMLVFAFIGGFILNFMPCVLPVIALKILGFVNQSKESPGMVKHLGLFYALGVLVSFVILAGVVIGVQQAGRLASWGLQFQNVEFLVLMMILMTLVALNFFGVFEINLGGKAMGAAGKFSGKEGYSGAFFNGVLATVLATPCTAPFLAPALGFAFDQPAALVLLFFITIALGLAFPYVVLSWNPALIAYLPKPGPWMERFKVAMGFPMIATAVWLYSVALAHFSPGAEFWLGLLLVVVALSAWIWGRFVQQVTVRRPLSMGIALLVGVGGFIWILEGELKWRAPQVGASDAGDSIVEKGIEWRFWSHAAVIEARAAGHPVLVDFTAKWCPNCQWNKRFSIEVNPVREKLKAIGAVTFRADFTHYDPKIAEELERYERAGVPLVLVFSPDANTPVQTLPPLLTAQIVLDALDKAANVREIVSN